MTPMVALLAVLCAQAQPAETVGRLMLILGEVTVERASERFRGEPRSALQSGDRLRTGAAAGASLLLNNAPFLYLGPNTTAIIAPDGQAGSLRLERGEV